VFTVLNPNRRFTVLHSSPHSQERHLCVSRLKNDETVLYHTLSAFKTPFWLLLTGTPVQNNLAELWALLHFLRPAMFPDRDAFLDRYLPPPGASTDSAILHVSELHDVLRPFLLRRTKTDTADVHPLPAKASVVLYAPMTSLQRKIYVAVLQRDYARLAKSRSGLANMVMQLRKAAFHPYLFPGVEPEPFEEGEHLVSTSGKLLLLDRSALLPSMSALSDVLASSTQFRLWNCRLLKTFLPQGRKVLVFSTMSRILDIVQDYCHLRRSVR
jgi:chromodomain-helicase-DNA-binding protein 1-like